MWAPRNGPCNHATALVRSARGTMGAAPAVRRCSDQRCGGRGAMRTNQEIGACTGEEAPRPGQLWQWGAKPLRGAGQDTACRDRCRGGRGITWVALPRLQQHHQHVRKRKAAGKARTPHDAGRRRTFPDRNISADSVCVHGLCCRQHALIAMRKTHAVPRVHLAASSITTGMQRRHHSAAADTEPPGVP